MVPFFKSGTEQVVERDHEPAAASGRLSPRTLEIFHRQIFHACHAFSTHFHALLPRYAWARFLTRERPRMSQKNKEQIEVVGR
jgi:hypothetical protein